MSNADRTIHLMVSQVFQRKNMARPGLRDTVACRKQWYRIMEQQELVSDEIAKVTCPKCLTALRKDKSYRSKPQKELVK